MENIKDNHEWTNKEEKKNRKQNLKPKQSNFFGLTNGNMISQRNLLPPKRYNKKKAHGDIGQRTKKDVIFNFFKYSNFKRSRSEPISITLVIGLLKSVR